MPSATLQALSEAPTLLPPNIAVDPVSAGRWFASLPPQAQAKLKQRMEDIVRALPPVARLNLERYLVSVAATSPVPLGLGAGEESFDWGGLIVGVAKAGAGLYTGIQANRTQNQIAANQASSSLAVQAMLNQAAVDTNTALIAAQRDAAIAEQAAKTQRALVYAPTIKWSLLGLGVVALVGGGIFLARRGHR